MKEMDWKNKINTTTKSNLIFGNNYGNGFGKKKMNTNTQIKKKMNLETDKKSKKY